MSREVTFSSKHFENNLNGLFNTLLESLSGGLFAKDALISPEAQLILENPEDKRIIDEAVQEMKKSTTLKEKKVTLSDNKTQIILSVS